MLQLSNAYQEKIFAQYKISDIRRRHMMLLTNGWKHSLEGSAVKIAIYFEDLERFKQIQPAHPIDLKEFTDLLEITVTEITEIYSSSRRMII